MLHSKWRDEEMWDFSRISGPIREKNLRYIFVLHPSEKALCGSLKDSFSFLKNTFLYEMASSRCHGNLTWGRRTPNFVKEGVFQKKESFNDLHSAFFRRMQNEDVSEIPFSLFARIFRRNPVFPHPLHFEWSIEISLFEWFLRCLLRGFGCGGGGAVYLGVRFEASSFVMCVL
ncbi:hypothetical protein CEXT_506331 [Caerostris extrusa]|uniref:Uncharacterized protein n=1 Tax=Caerostris extrusa TaxID=172846 RepID=A0AAV4W3E0_CAEEX|nr:hypothetical protein CEXT_506331 [Caerostris extrusa]